MSTPSDGEIVAPIVSGLLQLIGAIGALAGGYIAYMSLLNRGQVGGGVAVWGLTTGLSIAAGGLSLMALGVIIDLLRGIRRDLREPRSLPPHPAARLVETIDEDAVGGRERW